MNFNASVPDSWDGNTALVLAHGAGQGMDSPFMNYFHREMSARGFLSVKFNFEYMEHGRKIPDTQQKLRARYADVISAVARAYAPRRIVIGGKSMGGRVASYIADGVPGVAGLVFLGYPLHPPGKPDQLRDEHLYRLGLPMLFISGTKDTFAKQELLDAVVTRLADRATMVWIKGGDHSLKTGRGGTEPLKIAADAIQEWIQTRVGIAEP
jgi:predicted alpha/beta-hydrolase family hydrolase